MNKPSLKEQFETERAEAVALSGQIIDRLNEIFPDLGALIWISFYMGEICEMISSTGMSTEKLIFACAAYHHFLGSTIYVDSTEKFDLDPPNSLMDFVRQILENLNGEGLKAEKVKITAWLAKIDEERRVENEKRRVRNEEWDRKTEERRQKLLADTERHREWEEFKVDTLALIAEIEGKVEKINDGGIRVQWAMLRVKFKEPRSAFGNRVMSIVDMTCAWQLLFGKEVEYVDYPLLDAGGENSVIKALRDFLEKINQFGL